MSNGGAPSAQDLEVSSLRRCLGHQLTDQAALPDAGVPVEHRETRHPSLHDLVKEGLQDCKLAISANDARLEVAGGSGFHRSGNGADERVGDDGLLLPLQAQLGRLAKGEGRLRSALRPFTYEHQSRLRGRLQAGRHVDCVPGHHWSVGANLGGRDHLAGVHADAQGEVDTVTALDVGRDCADAADDLACSAEGPGRVVLPHAGHAKDPNRGVTDEFLHGAAPGLDCGRDEREIGLQDRSQHLGIEQLSEPRGIHKVDEDDRGDLAFFRTGFVCYWLAAVRAEAGAGGDRRPAASTARRQRRPAVGAETIACGILRCAGGAGQGHAATSAPARSPASSASRPRR